jgi:hypothetical protein
MLALAFVLTRLPTYPDRATFVEAAAALGVQLTASAHAEPSPEGPWVFEVQGGGVFYLMAVAAAHPDAAQMPIGVTSPPEKELAEAPAHFILTAHHLPGDDQQQELTMAALTAALCRSVPSVAAMLHRGILFHRAELFSDLVQLAHEQGELPPQLLVDVTVAPEPDSRMSFLTHGMVHRQREELYVTCSASGQGALGFVYELVAWLTSEPEVKLPTGDTVGRSETERVIVQRVPNPTGEGPFVLRLDLDRQPPPPSLS